MSNSLPHLPSPRSGVALRSHLTHTALQVHAADREGRLVASLDLRRPDRLGSDVTHLLMAARDRGYQQALADVRALLGAEAG